MEEAVLAQLEQHPELLKPFFQYNSSNDHRLIWAFYHLIAEQQTEILSQPETLRHLIALTLNRGSELPPEVYFERYQQLLALCTPVLQAHEAAKHLPLDRLCLSPQCGFASCEIGNKLTEAQQWAKLALVKEIAEEVWG